MAVAAGVEEVMVGAATALVVRGAYSAARSVGWTVEVQTAVVVMAAQVGDTWVGTTGAKAARVVRVAAAAREAM